MDLFMEHYPYGSRKDVMEIINRYPHITVRDMENVFISKGPFVARCLRGTDILRFMERWYIHDISFDRETAKQKGQEHVQAGPLLHVHSVCVQPKSPENGPLHVYGTIRVRYQNIASGDEVQLVVYKRSVNDADYISPSGGNLVLFGPHISHTGITSYCDLMMPLYNTAIEVDLYLKIGDFSHSFAHEKFLVGGTTEGDVEELRSKEFQDTLCSATLSYIKMPFGALCEVEVLFDSKNEGIVVNLAGKIFARYKNTFGNYNSKPCVLFEKQNGSESVKMNNKLGMSRKLLRLPAYSSLEVELDLMDVNTKKPIKKTFKCFNEDGIFAGDRVLDVEGDFAIILIRALISYPQKSSVDKIKANNEMSLYNTGNPRYDVGQESTLIPSMFVEFYSIFIGHKKMGSALKIFGTVELSSGKNSHYLFKRTGNDGVEIEDSQKVLPLGDVHMRLDEYSMPELKVDLKDVGGKFLIRGFASHDRIYDTQKCSVFPGEEGFCALQYSIFSRAFQAKIEIFVKNKSDHIGPDTVYGSAIVQYSNFDYPTEFERDYFRSVLFKRTEKNSVRLKDDGRVPLS
ncbi:unnamed protein product [Cuscuta campestris]|uniref:DUF6598 domain-containing protein n=1 Tax=Cuscuta campestris TaxID=132261 RepID=A0A484L1Q2_9ASTE|nr:unnamed protein product [Cuscuta campestris]